ncbi:MAG: DNA replication/repair protein RecF [Clostridia bacterium]
MYIKKIKLENFRNYEKQEIIFNKNINNIYGDNAQGKTNILEAIFICGLGKSFRTNQDKELININKDYSNVEIEYYKKDREGKIKLELNQKKDFFINDIKVKKVSDILGKIYVVLFTPQDINILKNDPSKRRRFLNIMISQLRPMYVHILNKYNKTLEQRNNYLKQIKYENKSYEMLDIWDEQLVDLGTKIFIYRKEFLEKINNKIKNIHLITTQNKEHIEIKYKSNIIDENKYLQELKNKRNIDIQKGYTSIGIHRDDFEIFINNENISIYGSQGQQRSSIISLKLAEAETIYEEIEEYPIILLDDFMSELDRKRIKGFIENIKENQVIITSTEKVILDKNEINYYNIKNAKIEPT